MQSTEEMKESLRVQKMTWLKDQITKQREAEDALFEHLEQEQKLINDMNADINDNLDRTRESQKFSREFQKKMNNQIYEMHGVSEDKIEGIHEYKGAYYRGCAFSLFLLSVILIVLCGVLHGIGSQICLVMLAFTGIEGTLLIHDDKANLIYKGLCRFLYLILFPMMMVLFVCFELGYPEYEQFLPYFVAVAGVILLIGTASYFLYDPYREGKKQISKAKDTIRSVERMAKKEVKKNQRLQEKEEKKILRLQEKEDKKISKLQEKEDKKELKLQEKEEKKKEQKEEQKEARDIVDIKEKFLGRFHRKKVQEENEEDEFADETEGIDDAPMFADDGIVSETEGSEENGVAKNESEDVSEDATEEVEKPEEI